ncbi:MAG: GlsB/YeaQ/YmgE family stress response membrane protein [Mycobacteriales bacterium]
MTDRLSTAHAHADDQTEAAERFALHTGGIDVGILIWLVVGIVSGAVAISLVPGEDRGGSLLTLTTGAVGALVGGWIGNLLALRTDAGLSLWSLILAIVGAITALGAYRSFARRAR